jgi:hypothetical protein
MQIRFDTKNIRRNASVALFVVCALIVIWITTGFVRAYWSEKTVHIFPTDVTAQGWINPENALRQDLAPRAVVEDFGPDTSAYLFLEAEDVPLQIPDEAPAVPPQEDVVVPTFPPLMVNPEPPPSAGFDADIPLPVLLPLLNLPEDNTSDANATSSIPSATSTPPEDAATTSESQVNENVPPPQIATTSDVRATSSESIATTTESRAPRLRAAISSLLRAVTGTDLVLATTTDGTTTPPLPSDDVSRCATLGTPCHTIRFSKFNVSGDLRDI